MEEPEKMEYHTVRGTAYQVDTIVSLMLETGWVIISETDSRSTQRKFSGGKAVAGAALFGGVGLLAGGIGKDRKTGEVTVRLQRTFKLKEYYEHKHQERLEAERQAKEKAKLEKQQAKLVKRESKRGIKLEKQTAKKLQRQKPISEQAEDLLESLPLGKTPLSTIYWYKKLKSRHK